MDLRERILTEIQTRRSKARTNRAWAKFEILLGLLGATVGVLLGNLAIRDAGIDWGPAAAALALMVLGGYLALAGQRSHLYQSTFEQTGFLLDELKKSS
jgi:hypothetical protein